MIRISRKAIIIGSMSAVLLAGTGVATAAVLASPVGRDGMIHGRYTNAAMNGSHALVLQDAGTSCPTGTTAIAWSGQGPGGPRRSSRSDRPERPDRSGRPIRTGRTGGHADADPDADADASVAHPGTPSRRTVSLGGLNCGDNSSEREQPVRH